MPKKSAASKTIRKSAREIPRATANDIARLRAASLAKIDTTEIPERRQFQRLKRDENGELPPRKSIIRDAVMRELERRELSVYRLWQLARAHYPLLSQSAVHEFLKGQRQLELPSIEALLSAVDLQIVRSSLDRGRSTPSSKRKRANIRGRLKMQ